MLSRCLPLIVITMAFALAAWAMSTTHPQTSDKVVAALAYLDALDSEDRIVRYHVSGNTVFVEFNPPAPEHWEAIYRAAAIWGNKATGREFHAVGEADIEQL